MDYKTFELRNRSYQLFQDGTLKVFTVSQNEWVPVLPKKVVVGGEEYLRYALYDPRYDWTDDNKESVARYEKKVEDFNIRRSSINMEGPFGGIVTNRLNDLFPPSVPSLGKKGEWKRFYRSHGSIVLEYWHGADLQGKQVSYVDNVPGNKLHVDNWAAIRVNYKTLQGGRKKISVGVVNTILANCGTYSTEYIGQALGFSGRFIAKVIHGAGGYDSIGDRKSYIFNIRASRGSFYNITCYPWEFDYDFINRVMVLWDNQYLYEKYCHCDSNGTRNNKGRMGYAVWEERYGRDIRVSKELMKRWVQMNAELIGDKDDVEELLNFINNWSLGGDRCWSLERYDSYIKNNLYRMPQKVKIMKGVPCTLRTVGVQSSNKTLYDLTDWELINLFDYCAGDFQGVSIAETVRFVEEELEAEPNWLDYEENGYESADEFWASYVSLLGGQSVGDFRTAYGDMLRSIPYTNEASS